MSKNIVLSGYYGFDNFGDDAILAILVRELKENLPDATITVLTNTVERTITQYGVNAVPRMSVKAVWKALHHADLFINGGGSLLQDQTSLKSLLYYLGTIFLSNLAGAKTVIFSHGIGPLNSFISRFLTKIALKTCSHISVRDQQSHDLLKSMTIKSTITADPVWLGLNNNATVENNFNSLGIDLSKSYIGVNIREWKTLNDDILLSIANKVGDLSKKLGLPVLILPFQPELDRQPSLTLIQFLERIINKDNIHFIDQALPPESWAALIKSCKLLISMRFHPLLVAMSNNIEVFGLSYDPKVSSLMESVQGYYCEIFPWSENDFYCKFNAWQEAFSRNLSYNKEQIQAYQQAVKDDLEVIMQLV